MRCRRLFAFSWVLLLGLNTVTPLEGLEVQESTFFPPRFFVGDRVEHVLVVETEYAQQLEAPETMPSSQWVDIHSVEVNPHPNRDAAEIRIQFSVFIPGTVSLPVVHLGAESLADREVVVRSLQPERGSELAETRTQMLLPGTQTALWLVSAALLLLPLLWMLASRYGSGWLLSIHDYLTAILPYRRLRSGVRRLAKRIADTPPKQYYIDLLQLLRQYFSEKTGQDCMSATTHELSRILENLSDDPAVVQGLKEVFRFGDMVKFAGTQAPLGVRSQHLIKVCRVTASIEAREPDIPPQVMHYVHS